MDRNMTMKSVCLTVAFALLVTPVLNTAQAGVISTERAIALDTRQERIEQIQLVLAEDRVRDALVHYGVDPELAAARVQVMSDTELVTLQDRVDNLPAGGTGVVEVVGIVAIVIILLELLGVTDVFKKL